MRVVITHPEMGIYLGSCMGLGFWTLLDTAGQFEAVTFPNEHEARDHVASWENNSDPAVYTYASIACGTYATVADLAKAGLGDILGDMLLNISSQEPCARIN